MARENQQIPIYCISVSTNTLRRNRIVRHMGELGLEFEFIDAITPSYLLAEGAHLVEAHYNEKKRYKTYFKELTIAEISCALSHRMTLQRFIESQQDYCLIIEDNVTLDTDLKKFAVSCNLSKYNFDLLRPQYTRISALSLKVGALFGRDIICAPDCTAGASAIFYSKLGAQKTIKSLERFYVGLDTHIGQFWRFGLRTLSVSPTLARRASREEVGSSIDEEDAKATGRLRHGKDQFRNPLQWARNRRERWSHEVMKHLFTALYFLEFKLRRVRK